MSLLDTAIACAASNKNAFRYTHGAMEPNFSMPAIRYRTVSSLIKLGYTSALNGFDVDVVFDYYIKE